MKMLKKVAAILNSVELKSSPFSFHSPGTQTNLGEGEVLIRLFYILILSYVSKSMIRRPSNPATGVCHQWCLIKFVIILRISVKMVANLALKNIKFKFQELFYGRESHSTIISNNQRYTNLYIYTFKLFTST